MGVRRRESERRGGKQKRNDVVMSYIWPSYVGAPVWCVKILPGLRPAGTAVAHGGGGDADGVEREPMKGRFCVSSPPVWRFHVCVSVGRGWQVVGLNTAPVYNMRDSWKSRYCEPPQKI